jgi:hypothetical protein
MTQKTVLSDGAIGERLTAVGPEGPLNLILGQDASGFLLQTDWFVSSTGTGDGKTALTPITEENRQKAWPFSTRLLPGTAYTVTYLDSPATPVNYFVETALGSSLKIQGVRTQTKAAALTAVTALNRATQTPWDVTAVGLGAADVGRIIRITGGARAGNYARIMKDLGGGQVRTTPFGTLALSTFDPFVQVTPVIGDPIEIVTLPTLEIASAFFLQGSNEGASSPPLAGCIQFDSLNLSGGAAVQGTINSENVQVYLSQTVSTNLGYLGPGGLFMVAGGGWDGACFAVAGPALLLSGVGFLAGQCFLLPGVLLQIDGDTLIQGGSLFLLGGGEIDAGLLSFFDCANNQALVVNPGAVVRSSPLGKGADLIWGTANAGHGVVVRSGGMVAYVTKPTVNGGLGAGREALIGGVDTLWGGVPAVTAANLAAIVVNA